MRIFIALLFDETNKNMIYEYANRLKEHSKSGNYSTLNNLHLTMLFIGQTDFSVVEEIYGKLSEIKSESFEYQTGNISYFEKSRNRKILYLSLKDTFKIKQLHVKIVAKINELGMDFNINKFTPHITLAREVLFEDGFDNKNLNVPELKLKAKAISIMESKRVGGELVYQELYNIPLE